MCLSEKNLAALQSLRESMPVDNADGLAESTSVQDAEIQTTHSGKTLSTSVVSIMAYLIGVQEDQFGKKYKRSVYDELEHKDSAKTIRALCTIRNAIMRNTGSIYNKLRQEIKNLDSIPEFIDPALFRYLEGQKIRIVTGTQIKEMTEYVALVNNHISNKIGSCAKLFPSWVNWEYIKDLMIMPGGGKTEKIKSAIDKLKENFNSYPFACYVNWPISRTDAFVEDPEHYTDPITTGNILCNDKKFMVLLYRVHGDAFQDFARVFDASEETKNALNQYMFTNDGITLLVDCENSDPYKLCAFFDFMNECRRQHLETNTDDEPGHHFGRITKVILYDDYHTIDAWDILSEYIKVPIIHEEVERVLGHKSLVDIAMTVGACKEHLQQGVNSFMIASSDSDYWGLIRAMPDANFLVLAERTKFSPETQHFYDDHGVVSCFIDDFAGNLNKIKEGALRHGLEKHINNLIAVNLYDTLTDMYDMLRLEMSPQEKENFRKQLLRSVKIDIDDQGEISVRIEK